MRGRTEAEGFRPRWRHRIQPQAGRHAGLSSQRELAAFTIPSDEMKRLLPAAGGATTVTELGVPVDFYREAIVHCREMRNRFFLGHRRGRRTLEAFAQGRQ